MKKVLSLVLIVSLVFSLAVVLGACGKDKVPDATTTESEEYNAADALHEMYSDLFGDEEYSYSEHSTDEHYEEDFEALTLPSAKPTTPTTTKAAGQTTTMVQVRETTTKSSLFTSPSTQATTKKNASDKPAAATTTKPGTTNPAADQTSMAEITTEGKINVLEGQDIPTPNVTYLDKFVIKILSGTSYTAKTEMHAEDMVLPITYAVNGNKSAVSMTLTSLFAQEMELPAFLSKAGEIKLINDGKNFIMCFPGGYTILEGEGIDEFQELFEGAEGSQDIAAMLQLDKLKYRGYKQYSTYVTETYRNEEEGTFYVFYFDSEGLAQWEVYDADSGEKMETMVIKLKAGASADLFKYSGQKYTMEQMENLFGGMA